MHELVRGRCLSAAELVSNGLDCIAQFNDGLVMLLQRRVPELTELISALLHHGLLATGLYGPGV
jgi:hypothetical protein